MSAFRKTVTALLWCARSFGAAWIIIGAIGLAFAGKQVNFDVVLFILSMTILTFAPQKFYQATKPRIFLLAVVAVGSISPIRLTMEKWPQLLGSGVQIAQSACLVLFLFLLGLGARSRDVKSVDGPLE